jgi:hypothetical protein
LNLAHVLEDRAPAAIPVPLIEKNIEKSVDKNIDKNIEKRIHTRFDKAFLVMIGSELYGDTVAVARNISAGGILVEMSYAPPLGTVVTVHFQHVRDQDELDGNGDEPRDATRGGVNGPALPGHPPKGGYGKAPLSIDELVVRAEVKHHHYLNFTGGNDAASARAIGLRFLEFVDPDERIPPERCH